MAVFCTLPIQKIQQQKMDLLKILDSTPEPPIIDPNNFVVDTVYAQSQDYKIITPLTDFQKELFDQIVSLHYSDILKFYIQFQNEDGNLKDKLIIDSLKVLLENSSAVSNHPYLLIDHFFPKNLTSRDIYKKLIETSGKFKILNDLIDIIESLYVDNKKGKNSPRSTTPVSGAGAGGGENFNLVIVSKSGKCMDLIESLLLAHSCTIKKYSGEKLTVNVKSKKNQQQQQQQSDDESSFIVHLLPSDFKEVNNIEMYEILSQKQNLNLLISFDISVNTDDEYLQKLITTSNMPIIRLVPNNTIEHIALYFRKSFKDKYDMEYLKPVTAAIVCLRDKVGLIPSELKSIYATNLKYLTDWFKQLSPSTLIIPQQQQINTKNLASWPLPDLRPIKNFNSNDVEKSLLKEVKFENDEDELLQLPNHYKISPKSKISYYKSKRLKGSYITNPIEYASYNKITGISSNIPENTNILTHKMILNYNLILQRYDLLNDEYGNYVKLHDSRLADFGNVQSVYDTIDKEVSKLRELINDKNEELKLKQLKIDDLKLELTKIDTKIEADSIKAEYLHKKELKDAIDLKIVNKKQENEYMLKEIVNAKKSAEESQLKIEQLQQENKQLIEQLNNKSISNFIPNQVDLSNLEKSNSDLIKVLEKNLKKINDIPISQKLRIKGVNNNIFGGVSNRR